MAESASYKAIKEAFVSDNAGDTVFRVNSICWTAISTYHLWRVGIPLLPLRYRRGWYLVLAEYAILVLPLILSLTLLSGHPLRLNTSIYALIALCYVQRPPSSIPYTKQNAYLHPVQGDSEKIPTSPHPRSSTSPVTLFSEPNDKQAEARVAEKGEEQKGATEGVLSPAMLRRPFVSTWRAHMMLMTVICILAVDFPIYPRSFGKCETWGTSIMDLGVGSFVFALGFVSAGPFLLNLRNQGKGNSVGKVLRNNAIVLALGFIRILSVKGTDYPEHVTEYGVHWNFFFTLGILPLFGLVAERFWHRISFRTMALLVTAIHQVALIATSLQGWTISSHRAGLISQNKEGLVSLVGYLAIYLLGYDTGLYTLPPDPYLAYRPAAKKTALQPKVGKTMNVLFSYAAVWWTVFGVLHLYMPPHFAVSRRLANSAYVFWVAAFNVSFLLLYLAVDQLTNDTRISNSGTPAIFAALNKNGLPVFLLANLLTGALNLSMHTMYASNATALSTLVLYTLILVVSAIVLRRYRLKL